VISDGNNLLALRDTFPAGFVVEEVLRNPYGGTVSGLGTNTFTLTGFTAENGVDTILLRVRTGAAVASGPYTFQATLNDVAQSTSVFPANTIQSDYLPSIAVRDASPIVIREPLAGETPETDFQRCAGDVVVLDPFSPELDANLSFDWSTGEAATAITVAAGGEYVLIATDLCGRQDTFRFMVTDDSVEVDLGPDLFGTYGTVFPLTPDILTTADLQSLRYYATDTTILSCTDCSDPLITPTGEITTIRLEATTIFGCQATDSLTITLERPLYQPTGFSPNGDGVNDCFQIFAGGRISSHRLEVYDRWGGQVFSGPGGEGSCATGWDGQVNGQPAPTGVYTYLAELTFPDGSTEQLQGVFTLLR
jgi:gliding motility-associated-like protein